LIDIHKDTLENIYSKYRAYFLWPKIYFEHKKPDGKTVRVIIEKLILNEKLFESNKDEKLFEGKVLNECIEEIILKPE